MIAILLLLVSGSVHAQDAVAEPSLPTPFSGILQNTGKSIARNYFAYPLAGIGSTFLISGLGIDNQFAASVNGESSLNPFFKPVRLGVYLIAPAVIGGIFVAGKITSKNRVTVASYMVMQATAIALAEVTVLKFITGRPPRNLNSDVDLGTQSQTFHFGLGREGIIAGWPSGHTTTVMAIGSSLTHYYPDLLWLKFLAYGATAYTAVSVTFVDSGTMHWFSDAVAASFIGYSVGSTVGDYYRESYEGGEKVRERSWHLTPVVSSAGMTAVLSYAF